jgi:hypothetical protein
LLSGLAPFLDLGGFLQYFSKEVFGVCKGFLDMDAWGYNNVPEHTFSYYFGILVYNEENIKKIEDDFMFVKSDKNFLLLGIPWIDRANAILDFWSRQLTISLTQCKNVTILISLHKRKTNVISLNIDFIDIKKFCILKTD